MSDKTQVKVNDNGPLLIKGEFSVIDGEGKEFTIDKPMAAICRCGASTTQPFCNGAHLKLPFESVVRVPQGE
ncbi:CDGSH iron-sulfur domain-containing protein [filamentous cyanobacterium LEGE 11480]|uniref:CDGSH iron-sulfur domain-containing protein n=1 Tax=Romeriopsis navalis LEGE 11480 TaxID=2777977 RepID=A0A928Z5Z5_9CYAN|nr:CDGSH iron-sulfur domain-containing protein [Romeriopsis navalis]MBE9033289.1 CDGSH iron-sulfur domain-containing protein [Romeriopsis navalis LEGE 11480]